MGKVTIKTSRNLDYATPDSNLRRRRAAIASMWIAIGSGLVAVLGPILITALGWPRLFELPAFFFFLLGMDAAALVLAYKAEQNLLHSKGSGFAIAAVVIVGLWWVIFLFVTGV